MTQIFKPVLLFGAITFSFYTQANICVDFYNELALEEVHSSLPKSHQEKSDAKEFVTAALQTISELTGDYSFQSLKNRFKAIRLEAQQYNLSSADINRLKKSMSDTLGSYPVESWQAVDFMAAHAELKASFKHTKQNRRGSKKFTDTAVETISQLTGDYSFQSLKTKFKTIRLEAQQYNLSDADINRLKKSMTDTLDSYPVESWQAVDLMAAYAEISAPFKRRRP